MKKSLGALLFTAITLGTVSGLSGQDAAREAAAEAEAAKAVEAAAIPPTAKPETDTPVSITPNQASPSEPAKSEITDTKKADLAPARIEVVKDAGKDAAKEPEPIPEVKPEPPPVEPADIVIVEETDIEEIIPVIPVVRSEPLPPEPPKEVRVAPPVADNAGNNISEKEIAPPKKTVRYKRSYPVKNLLIVPNYETPRHLAEAARKDFDVPYILVPAEPYDPQDDTDLVFIPGKKGNELNIKAKDLSVFLAYFRPNAVVFLGNADFLSPLYRKAIPPRGNAPKGISSVLINDANWKLNAIKLDCQLNSGNRMEKEFQTIKERRAAKEAERKKLASKLAELEK